MELTAEKNIILYQCNPRESASKQIRILEPLHHLRMQGYEAVSLDRLVRIHDQRGDMDPDILSRTRALFLFITDICNENVAYLQQVIHLLSHSGIPLIVDTDDHYFLEVPHIQAAENIAPHREVLKWLVETADQVTVSVEPLRHDFLHLNPSIRVIPNAIDLAAYPHRCGWGGRLRVGWAGGNSHCDDLAWLLPVISRLLGEFDFDLVLFGLYDQPIIHAIHWALDVPDTQIFELPPYAQAFRRLAVWLNQVPHVHVPSVPFAHFPRTLAELNLDIGLCPALDTPFNRCRSEIKWYQYAAVGTVSLASDILPYRSLASGRVENNENSWYTALRNLIENASRRQQMLEDQQNQLMSMGTSANTIGHYISLFHECSPHK